jgi:hypothetical protein
MVEEAEQAERSHSFFFREGLDALTLVRVET